jgi:hypothetical protein
MRRFAGEMCADCRRFYEKKPLAAGKSAASGARADFCFSPLSPGGRGAGGEGDVIDVDEIKSRFRFVNRDLRE